MYGYCSKGGAFLADRNKYLEAGGENENFLGWGPEDFERVKRMEILHQTVHFAKGPLFHYGIQGAGQAGMQTRKQKSGTEEN
jgi:predicted glycosyltransferase involved in capsule biosynthesis